MPDSEQIHERLQASRKELLDLTYRNKLLNFVEARSKGVRVIDENPADVFRILYDEQQLMSFAPVSDTDSMSGEKIDSENALERYIASRPEATANNSLDRHLDKRLQTPYVQAVLESRLLNTFYDARSTIEEHGVNTLFLALGMLGYTDPVEKSRVLKAPVLLLPVTLERKSARADFVLSHNGDELGHNVSLQAKLREGFGVEWPDLPAEDGETDFDLNAYFDRAEAVLAGKAEWSFDRTEIHLAFFSFHKFVMHQDLDSRKWPEAAPLAGQPVLRWLLGEGSGQADDAPVVTPGTSLDDLLAPETLFHVVEADSSQAEALAEIASGKTMIIQGPPGTGKSQTITNLIAQAVAQGKTVLFVAEKMAALEVVQRRLTAIGLGDIAIELHSNKTNKRDFLNRLKAVWERGAPVVEGTEQAFEDLRRGIRELNTHAGLVNGPIGRTGRSAFFLFGRLIQLQRELAGKAAPSFAVSGWDAWTGRQFSEARDLAGKIQIVMSELGRLAEHPFRDSRVLSVLPMELAAIERLAAEAAEALAGLAGVLEPLRLQLGLSREVTWNELLRILETIRGSESWPDLSGIPADHSAWHAQHEAILGLIGQVERIQQAKAPLAGELTEAAWSHGDAGALQAVFAAYQSVWYRWFCPAYRAAAARAAPLWRIRPPFGLAKRMEALRAILDVQQRMKDVMSNRAMALALFGPYWNGEQSDVHGLRDIADSLEAFHRSGLEKDVFAALAIELAVPGKRRELLDRALAVEPCRARYAERLAALLAVLEIDRQALDPEKRFGDYTLGEQAGLFNAWSGNGRALLAMARYNGLRQEAERAGLGAVQDACSSWPQAATHLVLLFDFRWFEAVLKGYLQEHPELGQFSRGLADRRVEGFRAADRNSLRLNRGRILLQHHEQLPSLGAAGELGVLSREFSKRARHLPIRTLLDKCGLAIQRAKPVFMMSPYSVASYLPRGTMPFDLVIFDEASQVRPVDALGALSRGRQAIVVGDSKQLPPTTFFEQMQDDEAESEPANQTRDIESILKQFESKGAFSTMLRWHYRSRHHTLIGYSNKAFYEDKLVVFPSPAADSAGQGLRFVHVPEGVYQRGDGRHKNPGEAERVVREVQAHILNHPGQSLGVVAFSLSQMREIQERVDVLRRSCPEVESFFASHPDEPFFVKNLETVQGDERDVIFISVGYGKDESGRLWMNFGPLNREGGERRLNVLVSRAKERCLIFSNIRADDLEGARAESAGVRHLQGVLRYAENGGSVMQASAAGREDAPFEDEVASALQAAGYAVSRNIGAGGFSIDLGVRDSRLPDRFLLGIECDGDTYFRSRWARDRDRLRQQVLEGLGWRLHRVWSRAWFDDPARETNAILEAIGKALAHPAPAPVPDAPPPPFERRQAPDLPARSAPAAYAPAQLGPICKADELANATEGRLAEWIMKVVRSEAPVHGDVAMRRIAEAAGLSRIGNRFRQRFDAAAAGLVNRKSIDNRNGFLRIHGAPEGAIRDRSQADALVKNMAAIAPEEIEMAFLDIIRRACSIEKEECFKEVLGLLGLDILSQQRRAALEQNLAALLADGRLAARDGRLIIPEAPG